MSGILLATLIPLRDAVIDRPVLALVGGYLAGVLYRILDRLTRTIESAVQGGASGQAVDEDGIHARVVQRINEERQDQERAAAANGKALRVTTEAAN
jgi:hypothetical protein